MKIYSYQVISEFFLCALNWKGCSSEFYHSLSMTAMHKKAENIKHNQKLCLIQWGYAVFVNEDTSAEVSELQ